MLHSLIERLRQLRDVDADQPDHGDHLVYDALAERWKAQQVETGAGFDPDEPQPYLVLWSPDDGSLWRVEVSADGELRTVALDGTAEEFLPLPVPTDRPAHLKEDTVPRVTDATDSVAADDKPLTTDEDPNLEDD